MNNAAKWGNIVREIQGGNEAAFNDLYEATQSMVLFRVRGYLDRGDTGMWVEDAVQETYIRAFRYLPELKEPDTVQAWLGKIAGSVCLNMLKKNGRMSTDSIDDEDRFDLVLEADESVMPDRVVDRQDTSDIVAGMIEKLPSEQRMTLLYYYYDLLPVKEIATIMECSENTVKSRLKYGRDNIEKQVRAEEKRGIKLYSLTPATLFLVFSQMEKGTVMPDGMSELLAQEIAEGCGYSIAGGAATGGATVGAAVAETVASVGSTVVKQTFFHMAGGKILAGILGVAIIGGVGAAVGLNLPDRNQEEPPVVIEEVQEPEEEPEETEEQEPVFVDVADEEYAQLLAGGLSKDELETALAGILEPVSRSGMTDQEAGLLAIMLLGDNGRMPVAEMNRYLSAISPEWVVADNTIPAWQALDYIVEGDQFAYAYAASDEVHGEGGNPRSANITKAQVKDNVMYAEYEFTDVTYDYTEDEYLGTPQYITSNRTAVFARNDDGKFTLSEIYEGRFRDENVGGESAPAWKTAYIEALRIIGSGGEYCLRDMNGDGIPELICQIIDEDDGNQFGSYEVYTWQGGDHAVRAGGFENVLFTVVGGTRGWVTTSGSSGALLSVQLMAMSGATYVDEITLQNGSLVTSTLYDNVLFDNIPDTIYGPDLSWVSTAPPYDTLNNY